VPRCSRLLSRSETNKVAAHRRAVWKYRRPRFVLLPFDSIWSLALKDTASNASDQDSEIRPFVGSQAKSPRGGMRDDADE